MRKRLRTQNRAIVDALSFLFPLNRIKVTNNYAILMGVFVSIMVGRVIFQAISIFMYREEIRDVSFKSTSHG